MITVYDNKIYVHYLLISVLFITESNMFLIKPCFPLNGKTIFFELKINFILKTNQKKSYACSSSFGFYSTNYPFEKVI